MKTIKILAIAILTLTQTCYQKLYAQDCKYKTQKIDKFTGESETETLPISLCKKLKSNTIKISKIEMTLNKTGTVRTLTLSFIWQSKGYPMFSANYNNRLILLLDNNETVELPLRGNGSDFIKNKVSTHFSISNDVFSLLKIHNITDVRAIATLNSFDFNIEDDITTTKIFDCIE